jgi:EAL and modified HD-GYP domain-containing signal transduction protein
MDRVLLSRQPIFQGDMSLLGYELLFRDGDFPTASISDGAQATAQVMANSLMEIGMDELVGRHPAFINIERKMLLADVCESVPSDRVVLELLETVVPDERVLKRLANLRSKGYRIALDDFVCAPEFSPLLELADFVKLDLTISDWPTIEKAAETMRKYPLKLIAEKVETREQFEKAKSVGLDHFQGYFFCRPENIPGRRLPVNRLAAIRLLVQLNNSEIRLEDLEQSIGQNVSLSYKLLRYINSAMCGLDRPVESIRHATVLVGLERMRLWASLIVFSGFDDTPRDVIVTGALRARMCEQLAVARGFPKPERFFLVGLFSVLDAILNRSFDQLLPTLSLAPDIADALVAHKDRLGAVLAGVEAYECRDWGRAEARIGLDLDQIRTAYQDALAWSARTLNGFGD